MTSGAQGAQRTAQRSSSFKKRLMSHALVSIHHCHFRLSDQNWQFNLDTKGTGITKGTWQLTAMLSDGSQHVVRVEMK